MVRGGLRGVEFLFDMSCRKVWFSPFKPLLLKAKATCGNLTFVTTFLVGSWNMRSKCDCHHLWFRPYRLSEKTGTRATFECCCNRQRCTRAAKLSPRYWCIFISLLETEVLYRVATGPRQSGLIQFWCESSLATSGRAWLKGRGWSGIPARRCRGPEAECLTPPWRDMICWIYIGVTMGHSHIVLCRGQCFCVVDL
jgi:hypothetical protein